MQVHFKSIADFGLAYNGIMSIYNEAKREIFWVQWLIARHPPWDVGIEHRRFRRARFKTALYTFRGPAAH